jgi:diphthamide biosynthesis protein 3
MGAYYDEIEIEDMAWDDVKKVFHYPCPCGDRFEISRKQLKNCEDIAICPSCSLIIRVVYDPVSYLLHCLCIYRFGGNSLISKTSLNQRRKSRPTLRRLRSQIWMKPPTPTITHSRMHSRTCASLLECLAPARLQKAKVPGPLSRPSECNSLQTYEAT